MYMPPPSTDESTLGWCYESGSFHVQALYMDRGGSFQVYRYLLTKCNFIVSWKCKSIHDYYYYFFTELKIQQYLFSSTQLNIHKLLHAVHTKFIHS